MSLRLLRPHEMVVWHRVIEVLEAIISEGAVLRPLLVEARHYVILDGHHRLAALRLLGAQAAPVVLVDYERHVSVSSWRPGVRVTKADVVRAALSGRLMPPKTSRHRLLVKVDAAPVGLDVLLQQGPTLNAVGRRGPGARAGVGVVASGARRLGEGVEAKD